MSEHSIYRDIALRTGGDIYIGVVGPVRTGKSTFIKRFMETTVLPNIKGEFDRTRAVDEMPQSASGKTVMTTEPKFVPDEAVEIAKDDGASLKVKMIDCVGYIVPEAIGHTEEGKPLYSVSHMEAFCRTNKVLMGIITVPAQHAQEVCDLMVACGIKAIWNFAPTHLDVPENILVQNENMATSLAVLSMHLQAQIKEKK